MSDSYFKYCPNCRTPAPLTAPLCQACGRVFQTRFDPPSAPPSGPARRTLLPWLLVGISVIVLVTVAISDKLIRNHFAVTPNAGPIPTSSIQHPASSLSPPTPSSLQPPASSFSPPVRPSRTSDGFNPDVDVKVTTYQNPDTLAITFLGQTEQRRPGAGEGWLVCQLTVVSRSEKVVPITTGDVQLLGTDGHMYTGQMFPVAPAGVRQLAVNLVKGARAEGDVVFELPEGVRAKKIGVAPY